MYKSLLRKNRIPSTALESLKGALSCFNFFSRSHETVSISAGGALSQLAPTKAQASSTLCPMIPRYSSPSVERVGRGIPGQGLAMALEEGPGKAWCKWGAASLSNKWVNSSVKAQHGLRVRHEDSHRQYLKRTSDSHTGVSHSDTMNNGYMCASAVLSGGCVVLHWRGSLSCEWKARP